MWHCLGIGLTAFSLLLNIVGLAIPYWYYGTVLVPRPSNVAITVYLGLWQTCGSSFLMPRFCETLYVGKCFNHFRIGTVICCNRMV